ncbi:undecaprenyl-diphosphate phosphatase [Calidifontibacter terrae]
MSGVSYLDSTILGVVEGLTEFLPVSSTGHLTIAEKLLGLKVDDPAITSYTAVIQIGAIIATFVFFWKRIVSLLSAWFSGITHAEKRNNHEYQLAWAVIVGSIPVGIVGFAAKDLISGPLRSLWVVAAALIIWSGAMWWAERAHSQRVAEGTVRDENDVTIKDGLAIGLVQCLALIPGVSRSGATISAGLGRGIDRVTATNLSFFMAIPALTAAGLYELKDVNTAVVGYGQLAVGTVVAFVIAYASIAWLLRFVRNHPITVFVSYRVVLGLALIVVLAAGWMSAT